MSTVDRRRSISFAVEGGVAIALGIAVVLTSLISSIAIRPVMGSSMMLGGIASATALFANHRDAHPLWGAASIVLRLITGMLVLSNRIVSDTMLPLAIAAYFVVNAVVMVTYAGGRHPRERQREWIGIAAGLSSVSSILLLRVPDLMGPLLGVNFAAGGLALLRLSGRFQNKSRHRRPG